MDLKVLVGVSQLKKGEVRAEERAGAKVWRRRNHGEPKEPQLVNYGQYRVSVKGWG